MLVRYYVLLQAHCERWAQGARVRAALQGASQTPNPALAVYTTAGRGTATPPGASAREPVRASLAMAYLGASTCIHTINQDRDPAVKTRRECCWQHTLRPRLRAPPASTATMRVSVSTARAWVQPGLHGPVLSGPADGGIRGSAARVACACLRSSCALPSATRHPSAYTEEQKQRAATA